MGLKILHLHDRMGAFGGGEVYLAGLREGLQERGHANRVLYLTPEGSQERLGPGEFRLKKPLGIVSGRKIGDRIVRIIEEEGPDVIHLHTLFSPVALARVIGIKPTVFTLHSLHLLPRRGGREPLTPLGLYDRLLLRLTRRVLGGLDGWIAPSEAFRDQIEAEGFAKGRATHIPHFTQTGGEPREEAGNRRTILFVGRLSWEKGIIEFIEALGRLPKGDWVSVVVGEGPLKEAALKKAEALGLSGTLRFLGRLSPEALHLAYQDATLIVVPSMVLEAFGLVGIEAMSFSKPVVAFDAGGVRDWLVHGENGLLVERGNIDLLAKQIFTLLENPQVARRMGLEGRRRVEASFRRGAHLDRVIGLYHKVISARQAGGRGGER